MLCYFQLITSRISIFILLVTRPSFLIMRVISVTITYITDTFVLR